MAQNSVSFMKPAGRESSSHLGFALRERFCLEEKFWQQGLLCFAIVINSPLIALIIISSIASQMCFDWWCAGGGSGGGLMVGANKSTGLMILFKIKEKATAS